MAPNRIRWWILLLLFLAMALNILDRQVLSLVAPLLRDQFHLSNTQYGVIVFSFLLGMTLGQVPVGTLMDRKGARFAFPVIVGWWSCASLLHAGARSLAQFSALRFLLGVGECGSYSGAVKVVGQWFPAEERAFAAGLFNSGALAGSIVAPPVIMFLTLRWGWPAAFALPSLLGLLWIVPWLRVYREPPLQRKAGGDPRTRLMPLLALAPVWGVILMRTLAGPVTHFYWYWLPEYLKRERGMSLELIGLFAWMPFFSGGLGNVGGGWFSSRLIRAGWSVDRARKAAFTLGVALCLLAVLVPAAPNAAAAIALLCLASLGLSVLAANLAALQTDLFPQHVLARVTGLSGVGDGVMSMIMMLATGVVVDRFSYVPVFIAAGLLPVASFAALILLVGVIRPVKIGE